MDKLYEHRLDLSTSEEDFARVMEDYFGIFANDLNAFVLTQTIGWKYDDVDTTMTFAFEHVWELEAFIETLMDSPLTNSIYHFEEWSNVNRQNLTLWVDGKFGGLT